MRAAKNPRTQPATVPPAATFAGGRPWIVYGILALVAVGLRLPIALAGPDAQISLLADDASYYLEGARRAALHPGFPTMDGIHPTNGFHPLYFLILFALHRLFSGAPQVMVPVVMTLHLALNAAAAVLLVGVLPKTTPRAVLLACGVLFAASVGWLAHGLAGVENGLAAVLLLILVLRLRRMEAEAAPRRRGDSCIDGLLLGAALLARTDTVFFAAAFLGMRFAIVARRRGNRRALTETAVAAGLAAALVMPWIAANALRFGTIVQDSGAALRLRFVRTHAGDPAGWLHQAGLDLVFWSYRLAWTWGFAPLTGWLAGRACGRSSRLGAGRFAGAEWALVPLCAVSAFAGGNDPWFIDDVGAAALDLGLAAVAFCGGLWTAPPATVAPPGKRGWILLAAAALVCTYAFGLQAFQIWYTTGPVLWAVGVLTVPELASMFGARRRLGAVLVAIALLRGALGVHAYLDRGAFEGMDRERIGRLRALRGRLEALRAADAGDSAWGAFDSGELSYLLHPFPVTNLDGVMNHDACRAIADRDLGGWCARQGIRHVLGNAARLGEFERIAGFAFAPDSARTAAAGQPVFTILPPGEGGCGSGVRRAPAAGNAAPR